MKKQKINEHKTDTTVWDTEQENFTNTAWKL